MEYSIYLSCGSLAPIRGQIVMRWRSCELHVPRMALRTRAHPRPSPPGTSCASSDPVSFPFAFPFRTGGPSSTCPHTDLRL